jgi:transposase
LGLADYRVTDVERGEDGRLTLELERKGMHRFTCAGCGGRTGHVRDRKVRTWDDLPWAEHPVRLRYRLRRLGRCGNTYVREEDLSRLFADVITRIQISAEVADWITEALRESQDDKQKFHRASVMRLQQQYLAVQAKIDRAYEDRLAGRVSDDLWERKTHQWEQELADVRRDTALHETAGHDYAAKGSKILELAQTAPAQFVTQNSAEQTRMLKMLLSNCTFDRGSLSGCLG